MESADCPSQPRPLSQRFSQYLFAGKMLLERDKKNKELQAQVLLYFPCTLGLFCSLIITRLPLCGISFCRLLQWSRPNNYAMPNFLDLCSFMMIRTFQTTTKATWKMHKSMKVKTE
jgi:hypothetical protein